MCTPAGGASRAYARPQAVDREHVHACRRCIESICTPAGGASRAYARPQAVDREHVHARRQWIESMCTPALCLFCGGLLISTRTSAPPGTCRRATPSRSTPVLESLCMRASLRTSGRCAQFCLRYLHCVFDSARSIKIHQSTQGHQQQGTSMLGVFFLHLMQSALSCCLDTRDTSYVIIQETHA